MTERFGADSPITLAGVMPGGEALAIEALLRESKRPVLFLCRDGQQMAQLEALIPFFAPGLEVVTLPAWDCVPYDRISPHPSVMSERMRALSLLARDPDGKRVILASVNAATQYLPPRTVLANAVWQAAAGETLEREALVRALVHHGYRRAGKVMEPGEFALRGSLIDLFPAGEEDGLRLDFFGDTLETIRRFDPVTQVSNGQEERFTLLPASEVLLNDETIERFRQGYRAAFGAVTGDDPLYASVSAGQSYPGMEHWLPLFYERLETLFDYVPEALVVEDDLAEEAVRARQDQIRDHYDTRKTLENSKEAGGSVYHPLPPERGYLMAEGWAAAQRAREVVRLSAFRADEEARSPAQSAQDSPLHTMVKKLERSGRCTMGAGLSFAAERASGERNVLDGLKAQVERLAAEGRRTLVAAFSEGSADRLTGLLKDHGLAAMRIEDWSQRENAPPGMVAVAVAPLEKGFAAADAMLVSEQDLFGERLLRRKPKKTSSRAFFEEAASLQPGELVVHEEHGIGRFEGLETVAAGGAAHDCLLLVYEGGDKLFLPVENMDVITRYGADSEGAALDKLGGANWQARKARLKERIKLAAEQLLKVAAERSLRRGEALAADPGLYEEFAARFPFAETEDQLRAIEDTLADMAGEKPMDRLICGDVGFGKTEVALRAAFVAVQAGFQVAVVCPTTLLARQHAKTFAQRMDGFAVRVGALSRMVPAAEQRRVREGLKDGTVDIAVGTHALLAKTVGFKRLGLLIVDEEQRFGVAQKEKIKELKSDVHVLTLSATPIPRTLQLALAGVRELSLMTTPPVDRLAVRTFVMPSDPVAVREALLREHYRGGQSFYVAPRIKDLEEVRKEVTALVPEVKTVMAHGRMAAGELDEVMNAFYDGQYDVLISTSIIESGLDIPRANTMLIHRPDLFGLAQLYQMRGRVGRGKQRAYAYLLLPHRRRISDTAQRRLEVMQGLDALGMGFTVASHDMDIRGAGNLLGDEQSGHIREVGVELYQQMLEETITRLKAQAKTNKSGAEETAKPEEEKWSPQINLGLPVRIPEEYVPDLSLRMGLYKRASALENTEEVDVFAAELTDRFGPLPEETAALLEVVRLKQLCLKACVSRVDAGPKGVVLGFFQDRFPDPAGLVGMVAERPSRMKLRGDHRLVMSWEEGLTPAARLTAVKALLQELAGLAVGV